MTQEDFERQIAAKIATSHNPAQYIKETNEIGDHIVVLCDEIEKIWNENVIDEPVKVLPPLDIPSWVFA